MTKVYAAPAGYDPPDLGSFFAGGHYDRDGYDKAEREYVERLAALARQTHTGEMVGETLGFPWADGAARYMVWQERPLTLVHLALGDAWALPEAQIRGLRLADVRAQVARSRLFADMQDTTAEFWASQPVGTVLHYDNGFAQYVRGVVVDDGGVHKLRPTALVNRADPTNPRSGGWREYDLPRRTASGQVSAGYHADKIASGEAWQPHESCVYEWVIAQGRRPKFDVDPRTLPAIDLTVPPSVGARAESERLCRIRDEAVAIITAARAETPDEWRQVIGAAIAKLKEA